MPELPGLLVLIGLGLAVAGCLLLVGAAVLLLASLTRRIRIARRRAPTAPGALPTRGDTS
ncbi:hypothetical protein RM863_29250 [Streptomyces sp. DSM 41014]|uniref:Uncharacterized protein n=1 Tax=Streptomyces hintoniae TaxID=3075521 RepID=A0ABU2USR7_9ACTN|nr:hypothetical protein [Streptomyces sp. DSM 41014]MDT0476219.1 hypothetical protein [Streptomyces sp. DSM 41014]